MNWTELNWVLNRWINFERDLKKKRSRINCVIFLQCHVWQQKWKKLPLLTDVWIKIAKVTLNEKKKQTHKKNVLYDSVYINYKKKQSKPVLLEVRKVVTSEDWLERLIGMCIKIQNLLKSMLLLEVFYIIMYNHIFNSQIKWMR